MVSGAEMHLKPGTTGHETGHCWHNTGTIPVTPQFDGPFNGLGSAWIFRPDVTIAWASAACSQGPDLGVEANRGSTLNIGTGFFGGKVKPIAMRARIAFGIAGIGALASMPCLAGDVFRCNEGGKTVYTDQPCAGSAAQKRVDTSHGAASSDAEAYRAKIDRESAEFNARFEDREKAKREAAAADAAAFANQRVPIIVERTVLEPVYYPYAVNTCGGPGQRACRTKVKVETKPTPPPAQVPVTPKSPKKP